LKLIKQHNLLPSPELSEIEEDCAKAKIIWKKINILRNEVFAHTLIQFDESFDKARITPDEIRDLIQMIKSIINKITHGIKKNIHAFNVCAGKDTLQMLEDLKTFADSR